MAERTNVSSSAPGGSVPIKGGVVIRRARRRTTTTSSAYQPGPGAAGLLVSTAVALKPASLVRFDDDEFASAAFFPIDEQARETIVAATEEPAASDASAAPEVAAATESSEPTSGAEQVAAESAAPDAADGAAPAADAAAPVASNEDAEEDSYRGKVSRDIAERITEELRTAAEEQERLALEAAELAAKQAEEAAQAVVVEEEEAPAEEAVVSADGAPRTGPKILGRIDLTKKPTPVKSAKPALKTGAAPAKEEDKAADGKARKRKRKVVRKEDMFDAMERSFAARPRKRRAVPGQKVNKTALTMPKASKRIVRINEGANPAELARAMGVKAGEVLGALMRLGVMKTINDTLDFDTATLVAEEFDYTVENTAVNMDALLDVGASEVADRELQPRPPVVTVMGHVDHGKTSLLDVIREANVVASESGGITQHIGAYMVKTAQGELCFLDTPGHAAFTAMRARGASVTDVVILVCAADDGVMPQTIEAVNHAKAAEIPVVVAINKMDKPDANPDRVKQQLSDYGLIPEDWGGDTPFIPVSALKQDGIEELLEAVLLQAEVLELQAPPAGRARGTVIEARLDKGRGPVATVLVQEGKLRRQDYFVVGEITGRVRAMANHAGQSIEEALPSTPVEIIGLDGVPAAGDSFVVVEDPSKAEQAAQHRKESSRNLQLAASSTRMSLEDLQRQIASGQASELRVVIKADVDGSVEALKHSLEKLSNEEVALQVIHGAVGAVTESDVQLAMASGGIIVGFHVRPEAKARALAEREGIDIRLHEVIYEVVDEVKAALEGLLAPEYKEIAEGRVEVRDTFQTPKGIIAGSYVTEGSLTRGSRCRLLRDNVVIHNGSISSLRRFKDDVREVQTNYECGVGIENYNDIKVGDVIEAYKMQEVKRTLESVARAAASKERAEKAGN